MGRISMPQGKGSQLHNRRDYEKIGKAIPDNIQSYRTYQNVTIVDKDIRAAYKEIFGNVLQEYNKRQKRADRRIDDYYEHILKSKNGEKPFYEDVIQWGSMEDFRADPRLREKAKECLVEYARTFEARNPNLKLIGAYVHMDEASPHLHLDYIPVASGYKTGLQARNSLDKAMKQMGYVPVKESRINNATKLWKEHERAYFGELCRSKGLKVEAERKARGSLSVDEYKEAKSNMLDGLKENKKALINEIADKNKTAYELLCKIKQQQRELNSTKKQLEDIKEQIEKYKQQKDTAEKELSDVLEQIAFYKGDKSIALMSDFTLLMADDKHVQLPAIQKQIEELQRKYDQLKKQPPQIKTIEKVVEVKKEVKVPVEVPVEVKKEVLVYKEINVDYKSLHHKLANIMWRIYDKLLQHDDLHAAFNSAKIKDDVEYNDIAIAATESDDIIRGIDQQIKRNAKSR